MIYSEMVDKATMDLFDSIRIKKGIDSIVGLPNLSIKNNMLSGFVVKSQLVIRKLMLNTFSVRVLTFANKVDRLVAQWNLKGVHLYKGEFIEYCVDKHGKDTVVIYGGYTIKSVAFKAKYVDRVNNRMMAYKAGTEGYSNALIDYSKVCKSSSDRVDSIASDVSNILGIVEKCRIFDINGVEFDDGFTYHNMAGKSGKVGIVLGDVGKGAWLCATKSIDEFHGYYPASTGKPITDSKSKEPISKQVLKLTIGDTETWMDDHMDKRAPFNYRSIESVIEDAKGSIYSLSNIKPLINVRS